MRHLRTVRLTVFALAAFRAGAHALAQGGSAGRDRATPTRGSEPVAVRDARTAQRGFEFTRRGHLPIDDSRSERSRPYYGNGCPVRIGRICWWDNDDDGTPPPEPSSIRAARTRLLEQLERAAAADSANEWVAGQRVRYAVEARRPGEAIAAAVACRGSAGWCLGLRGVAYHLSNRPSEAAAAFDSADALRTPEARCAWNDVAPWLDGGAARAYHRLPCGSADRARWESRFWRLAQPLWLLPVNDLRNEWHARRIMARIHGDGANAFGMSWGDDLDECELRYGWPTSWSVRDSRAAMSMYAFAPDADRSVTGWEPAPSYDWVPRRSSFAGARRGVADVPDGAWTLRPSPFDEPTPMRYAPAYAGGGVGAPTHQIARFRHGDSAVVVGAYDAARDSLWTEGPTPPALSSGLFVVDDSGLVVAAARNDSAPRAGALVARLAGAFGSTRTIQSDARYLLGLEILQRDTVHTADGRRVLGRALRERTPLRPLAADARLSDLLLLRRSPGPAPSLDDAVDSAAGSLTFRRGSTVGLYWEQYGTTTAPAAPAGTPVVPDTIVVTATRLTRSLRERLASAIGLGSVDRPIGLRYPDLAGGAIGRAIGVTWPEVAAGDYRVEVTLVPGTPSRQPATTALVVHITED